MAAARNFDDRAQPPGRIPAGVFDARVQGGQSDLFDGRDSGGGVRVAMSACERRHGRAVAAPIRALPEPAPVGLTSLTDISAERGRETVVAADIARVPREDHPRRVEAAEAGPAIESAEARVPRDLRHGTRLSPRARGPGSWVVDLRNRRLHRHGEPSPAGHRAISAGASETPTTPLARPGAALTLDTFLEDLG